MKIAVIGTGRWGTNILATMKELEIEALPCNTRGIYAGGECSDNWLKLLDTRPDGVILAANPALNLAVMKHAALLGIPVMVEKPVAFFLKDVEEMAKLRVPILVDYIHLFNPHYQSLKTQIKSPITRIGSIGFNHGPFRHFSGLFDYGPHDLSMTMDLVPQKFQVVSSSVKVNRLTGGRNYHLEFKAGNTEISILCGNGGNDRTRKLAVFCENGDVFTYEDEGKSKVPLENAIKHFVAVINGAKPKPSFDLTVRIHTALHELGNQWEKDKR